MPLPASHEPTPLFIAEASNNPRFNFNTVGGRYVLLTFYGSASDPGMQKVLADAAAAEDIFDDLQACFFGVSINYMVPLKVSLLPMVPLISAQCPC